MTGAKFVLTGVVLGIPAALLVSLIGAAYLDALSVPHTLLPRWDGLTT